MRRTENRSAPRWACWRRSDPACADLDGELVARQKTWQRGMLARSLPAGCLARKCARSRSFLSHCLSIPRSNTRGGRRLLLALAVGARDAVAVAVGWHPVQAAFLEVACLRCRPHQYQSQQQRQRRECHPANESCPRCVHAVQRTDRPQHSKYRPCGRRRHSSDNAVREYGAPPQRTRHCRIAGALECREREVAFLALCLCLRAQQLLLLLGFATAASTRQRARRSEVEPNHHRV